MSPSVARAPAPGRHGGDVERIARSLGLPPESFLDLSASFNPVAPDIGALAAAHLGSLRRYPDVEEARRQLAEAIGVGPERLLLANGGAEAISLLAHEVGGWADEPEFSLYPRGDPSGPRWRSNPHNPTGVLAGPGERAGIWDEAFYPLATGYWSGHDDAALATVGSLTKLFACPGLRLGYAIAEPELIARLEGRQAEWSVGTLACTLLPVLLARADLPGWAARVSRLRLHLTELLDRHALAPRSSDANFVLCDAAGGLRDKLLSHGVIVRDCASFGLPGLARVAVPNEEGMERLAAALDRASA
jgi:histidinol-phosphate/aromatic aminotransferase/cobyric acid decarboxylase-like protein